MSFNRPKEKVRGAERRLKALEKWASEYEGYFPSEWSNERYVEFKIPALDRLINPPTTKTEYQVRAMNALLRAVNYLNDAKPKEYKETPINLIFTWPGLWSSRIIIFFDKAYHEGFYYKDDEWQKRLPIESSDNKGSNLYIYYFMLYPYFYDASLTNRI